MANGAPCQKKHLTSGLIVSKPSSFLMYLENYSKMKQYFYGDREREKEKKSTFFWRKGVGFQPDMFYISARWSMRVSFAKECQRCSGWIRNGGLAAAQIRNALICHHYPSVCISTCQYLLIPMEL
jgi:hypothetical protein